MGYNSWYCCSTNGATEAWLRGSYRWLQTNGFQAAGYDHLLMDDGWAISRNPDGTIQPGTNQFPQGIVPFINEVHANGFKFGLYTTYDLQTCAHLVGSGGFLQQDAQTYAEWGVDYVKIEGCTGMDPPEGREAVELFTDALAATGHPFFINLTVLEFNGVQPWMQGRVNSWRGTGDWVAAPPWGLPPWHDILHHIDTVAATPEMAGPGRFNDPDVILPSNDRDIDKLKAEFGMFCMMASPLLLGNLLFVPEEFAILTNAELIAIDQDPAVIQARLLSRSEARSAEVYYRPLGSASGTNKAVAFFNRDTAAPATMSVRWVEIGLPPGMATVRDLWQQTVCAFSNDSFTITVPPNTAWVYRIVPGRIAPWSPGTNYLSDMNWLTGSLNGAPSKLPIVRDRNAAALWQPNNSRLRINGVSYDKGLGLFADSRVEFFLGGLGHFFHAALGTDDLGWNGPQQICYRIYGDGRLLHESGTLSSGSATHFVDLDVAGISVLTLEVKNMRSDGSQLSAYANVADAYVVSGHSYKLLSLTSSNGNWQLTWQSIPSCRYRVEASADLTTWSALGIVRADATMTSATLSNPVPVRFLRVSLLP